MGEREVGEWTVVRRRRQHFERTVSRQRQGRRGWGRYRKGDIGWRLGESFFFRNFPDQCTIGKLRGEFEKIGQVEDVYVPWKRDKMGNRFGFVRFSKVKDKADLLEKLNSIWIGSHIIRAYEPLFQRSSAYVSGKSRGVGNTKTSRETAFVVSTTRNRSARGSYAEIVKGGEEKPIEKRGEVGTDEGEESPIKFQSTPEEIKWMADAFTGLLKEGFSWNEHGEEIGSECAGKIKITNMGSGLVLIQSTSSTPTAEVVAGLDEWEKFWFDWTRPWSGNDVCKRRNVWTRWRGVPIHAWSKRFFCTVSACFGGLIDLHEATKTRSRLDEAFVFVTTGIFSIDRVVPCEIDGVVFSVRVEEVRCMDDTFPWKILEREDNDRVDTESE